MSVNSTHTPSHSRRGVLPVGPCCVLDDHTSTPSVRKDNLSRYSGSISVKPEPYEEHCEMEYQFMNGQQWPITSGDGISFENGMLAPAGLPPVPPTHDGWEDFLGWQPGQEVGSKIEGVNASTNAETMQSLYSRRSGTINGQPSIELGVNNMASPASAGASIPYSFGQPTAVTPAFDFTSPASNISPMHMQSTPFPTANGQSQHPSRSPADTVAESIPDTYDTSARSRRAQFAQSAESLQHSASEAKEQRVASDSSPSSPEALTKPTNLKKRKSDNSEDFELDGSGQPPKKTAHNMIEKRYRTNLNDKIAALRDSVPSLRVMSRSNGDEDDDNEDLEGLAPAHKLNKATVLSKATEYIRHLEKRNKKLQDELIALKKQMESMEKMSMTAFAYPGPTATPDGNSRFDSPFGQASPGAMNAGPSQIQGMIPIPADMERMRRSTINQPPYMATSQPYTPHQPPRSNGPPMVNGRGSGLMNKVWVGSLAGVMLFEGFMEKEQSGEEPEGRGLFALPVSLLREIGNYLWPRTLMLGASPHEALVLFKLCALIGAFVYLLLPLFDFYNRPRGRKTATVSLTPAPSLAHPVELRRKAWLTAVQTVWVPRHQFLLEVAALGLKALKLSTRRLIGWQGYAWLWKVTKEQEEARVKAWDIALNAQLTGGDAEISVSRLVLSILASGTLPDTPLRVMLKALHIRVLLWEVANSGWGTWYLFDAGSMKWASSYWNYARLLHKMNANSKNGAEQEMPEHLQALLALDCDQVLVKPIIQRAYNLAWNRNSSEDTVSDDSTDSVVEDFAISSPLDALAAWLANLVINQVLESSLVLEESDIKDSLDIANAIAPPTSAVQVRALAARAVLIKENRLKNIEEAFQAMPKKTETSPSSNGSDSSTPLLISRTPISADIPEALVLAKCLALTESGGDYDEQAKEQIMSRVVSMLFTQRFTEYNYTLLSFAASFKLLKHFSNEPQLVLHTRPLLELMANTMRVWIGRAAGNPSVSALHAEVRLSVVESCLSTSKLLAGVRAPGVDEDEESDAGYGSLEEEVDAVKK